MANVAVLNSDDAARARDDRSAGRGIVIAGDRTREFRRARLHSVLVHVLRWGIPLSCAGLVGLYVSTMLDKSGYGKPAVPPSIAPVISKDFAMDNPRYEGFSKDGGKYVVAAKTAKPDFSNPTQIELKDITGEMFDARKSRTDLTAGRGVYDTKANKLDLSEGITVITQSGMRAQMQTATLLTKEGLVQSDAPVRVEMPTGSITADRLNIAQKTRDVAFGGHVVARLVPPPKTVVEGAAPAGPPAPVRAKDSGAFGNGNAPVDVTADLLEVHDGTKNARFAGNVKAMQGAARLETAALDVVYDGSPAAAGGDPATPPAPAAKIKKISSAVPVVMTQGTGDRVTGNAADFDVAGETATITGSVVMTSGADKRATADRVEFNQKSDGITLAGNVVVNAGRNELRGRRLVVDRKAGTTDLTAAAEGDLPRSRIFARLYQGDGQPGKPAPKKAEVVEAAAGVAGAAGLGMATFKTDPNAPVDIEADWLRSDDGKKQAVFHGNVKAAQGEFTIRTVEMVATYSGDAGLASVAGSPGAASGAPKAPVQLTKIEAKGSVIVASKQNQQVTGDHAVFDMKANTVVVSGKEVILTQEKNIITCNKLLIEMATGLSRCITSGVAAQGQPGTITKGRASVVFYPQERPKGSIAPVKPATPVKPEASSWESSVAPAQGKN